MATRTSAKRPAASGDTNDVSDQRVKPVDDHKPKRRRRASLVEANEMAVRSRRQQAAAEAASRANSDAERKEILQQFIDATQKSALKIINAAKAEADSILANAEQRAAKIIAAAKDPRN